MAGLALTHTIGVAVLTGLVIKDKPFFRTPKRADTQALLAAINAAREETLMLVALTFTAWAVVTRLGTESLDLLVWAIMLMMQAIPYACSLLLSLISALPRLPAGLIGKSKPMQEEADHLLTNRPAPAP